MIGGAVIIRDTETPKLARLRAQVKRPKALNAAAGKRVEKTLRAHFLDKDRKGNSKGWSRSHFWNRRIRTSTAFAGATDTGATVEIADPAFEQKLRGGTIRAKRAKFLAIPLTDRAKAAGSPREWNNPGELKFIVGKRAAFLGLPGQRPDYILLRSVNQKPDPTALPPKGTIEAALDDEAEKFFTREQARNA